MVRERVTCEAELPENLQSRRYNTLSELTDAPLADPSQLSLPDTPLSIASWRDHTGAVHYLAILEKPLGPSELYSLLLGAAPQKKFDRNKAGTLKDFRSANLLKEFYESLELGKPLSAGHQLLDMNKERKFFSRILEAKGESTEDLMSKPLAILQPLSVIEKNFLCEGTHIQKPLGAILQENPPHTAQRKNEDISDTANTQVDKLSEMIYAKFVNHCRLHPSLLDRPQRYKKKVYQKIFQSPPVFLEDFIKKLSPDEKRYLTFRFALANEDGYITQASDGSNVVILKGQEHEQYSPGANPEISIERENASIKARFKEITTYDGQAYALVPQEVRLKEYGLPFLHWSRTSKGRQWHFDTPSSVFLRRILPHEIQEQTGEKTDQFNTLLGITSLIYTKPELAQRWGNIIKADSLPLQPVTAAFIPLLAAVHQEELFNHPVIMAVEQHLRT